MKIHTIDLHFQNTEDSIAAFLIDSSEGLILFETGPDSTFDSLQKGIEDLGYQVEDVRHVFLTHIHFDHAGAAWRLAALGATIYVNPNGLNHLANPERLWNSAAQIYGDKMGELWGDMNPISSLQLRSVDDGDVLNFGEILVRVHYTPGHAVHHNAYQVGDYIFAGDIAGVKIDDGPVMPPCPPPDINIELWKESISKLRALRPEGMYLTHYGLHTEVNQLLTDLEMILDSWAGEIRKYYQQGMPEVEIVKLFTDFVFNQLKQSGVSDKLISVYEYANPSWMSVNGLIRYWKLKGLGRI